jgi:hypothetical protein
MKKRRKEMRFPAVVPPCRSSSPRPSVDVPSSIVVISLFLVALSVNLEVPFYSRYIQGTASSHEVTSLIFAAYVAGLLPVLLLLGGISDRMGRKPIIVLGMIAAWGATLAMTIFPALLTLFVTRLLQGIGVGLSLGAGTAYLKERLGDQSHRSAQFVTLMTTLGFGSGAILTSSLPMSPVALVPLSYWLVLVVTGCVLLLALGLPESLPCRIQQPLLRLPSFPKGTLTVGGAMALAWAGAGLVITFLPVQLAQERLAGWTGVALFLMNAIGALFQPLVRRLATHSSLLVGALFLSLGYSLLVYGLWQAHGGLVLLGTGFLGASSYGFTYLGGLARVTAGGGNHPAGTVSGYFLCAYCGFSLPSILIGWLADKITLFSALALFLLVMLLGNGLVIWKISVSSAFLSRSGMAKRRNGKKK